MESNLEGLIEKIKTEGVAEAKKASEDIIQQAKDQAKKIEETARKEAESLIQEAEDKAERFKRSAETSIKQAARDIILNTKEELKVVLDRTLKQELAEAVTPEFLKQIILKLLESWKPDKGLDLEVFVSKNDKAELQKLMAGAFSKAAHNNVEVKTGKNIDKGILIGIKGDDIFYDFSDDAIVDAFKELLNPYLVAVLENNNE